MSKKRTIKGKSKTEFMLDCFAKAREINPGWTKEIFHFNGAYDEETLTSLMWKNSSDVHGLQLSITGDLFFKQALKLDPYEIQIDSITGMRVVQMSKNLPWPYTVSLLRPPGNGYTVTLYSEEVAVWAALYGNDIDKLMEAYSR